jgi:hypothetical protein
MLHIRAYFKNPCTTRDFVQLNNADKKVNYGWRLNMSQETFYDKWLGLDEGEHLST